jgi:hypothetical protein
VCDYGSLCRKAIASVLTLHTIQISTTAVLPDNPTLPYAMASLYSIPPRYSVLERFHLPVLEICLSREGSYHRKSIIVECAYHWTLLRRPLCREVPSIILCVKKWNLPAPQRRGSSHSGEGQNGRFHLITAERRSYKKIPLVEFQHIYKTDLQNSFRPNRVSLRGVLPLVTQIPSGT